MDRPATRPQPSSGWCAERARAIHPAMEDGLPERVKTVVRALLGGEGKTANEWREQILSSATGGTSMPALPPELAAHVERVAHSAYKITDESLKQLEAQGHDEDVIFEVTLAAALGAGLKRLRKGLAALRASATGVTA